MYSQLLMEFSCIRVVSCQLSTIKHFTNFNQVALNEQMKTHITSAIKGTDFSTLYKNIFKVHTH